MATAARKRSRRRLVELACICFATAMLGWFVFPYRDTLIRSEYDLQDRLVAFSGARDISKEFVFLAIDDPSLQLDQLFPEDLAASPSLREMSDAHFPWPRSVYADAIGKMLGAGAKVVLIDLILNSTRLGDESLRLVLDKYPGKIVLGMNYTKDNVNPDHPDLASWNPAAPADSLIANSAFDPRVGFVNFPATPIDGFVRAAPYGVDRINGHFNSLAAAALKMLGKTNLIPPSNQLFPFRFANTDTIPTYPFYTLFVDSFWKKTLHDGSVFKDKIVIIGPSAPVLHDVHATPSGLLAGPLLHVNAISAALHGDFYRRAPAPVQWIIVFLAATAALVIGVALRQNPLLAVSALVATCALYFGVVYLAATVFDYVPPTLIPSAVLLIAGVGCISWNFAQARREGGRMRSMLDRYISRNLVSEVLDNRDDFLHSLGGARRAVTVFFSDVRGFTSFSEREDPHAVVEQLNDYLGEMVGIIFRHKGTVDKFMGDGIMAVWGNVVSEGPSADAVQSVMAALEMLERLPRLNEGWAARGFPPFKIGIGLHHGEAIFGNMGSAEKMEMTVIGDTVNLASRVEGLTKKYGLTFCITQPMAELVSDRFVLRSVDLVQVVGKSRPVEIFTVLGPRDMARPDWIKEYEGAIADFRARRFPEAAAVLRLCQGAAPEDKLVAIYLDRANAFIANPPPDDWTGAEIATSK